MLASICSSRLATLVCVKFRSRELTALNLMEWMPPPDGIAMCQVGDCQNRPRTERASMEKVTIIGIDLAKRVFPGARRASDGKVVFRKKLSRSQLLPFLADAAALHRGDGGLRDGP